MAHSCCTTSNCTLTELCTRHEDDAGKHLLTRTYAYFSEAMIRRPGNINSCLIFMPEGGAKPFVR